GARTGSCTDARGAVCEVGRGRALPKSALGQAAAYTLNMWASCGGVSITRKCPCPVALGRKNWLHVRNVVAFVAPAVFPPVSVVESRPALWAASHPIAELPRLG